MKHSITITFEIDDDVSVSECTSFFAYFVRFDVLAEVLKSLRRGDDVIIKYLQKTGEYKFLSSNVHRLRAMRDLDTKVEVSDVNGQKVYRIKIIRKK